MELEQRVGRVHRFMSKRTIQVHTLVVKDSREVDMYDVARTKLNHVAKTLGSDRFEELFTRVMALVPPEDLAGVLVRDALGPLSDGDQEELAKIVTAGYRRWQRFHAEFSAAQHEIRSVSSGQARWRDLERFAIDHLGARPVEGLSALKFRSEGKEVIEASEAATVLEIEGRLFACGDYASTPIVTPDGRDVAQLGLNLEHVCTTLRGLGLPDVAAGVAYLRWAPSDPELAWITAPCGILIYGRTTLSIDTSAYRESGLELSMHVVLPDGATREVERAQRGTLVRSLLDATVRREIDVSSELIDAIRAADDKLVLALRRPGERSQRHAVFPVAVMVLG
jgi:hypothetical protein